MALVSMRELLDHAAENGYGIPAFNVNNLEQVQAVMEAARETGAPVILQASAGARKYAGESFIKHLILAAVEAWPKVPLVMHQDHGQSPDVCRGAIDLDSGSSVMYLVERGTLGLAQGEHEGLSTLMLVTCPGNHRSRLGIWFVPEGAEISGSPQEDEAAIRGFIAPFRFCAG